MTPQRLRPASGPRHARNVALAIGVVYMALHMPTPVMFGGASFNTTGSPSHDMVSPQ